MRKILFLFAAVVILAPALNAQDVITLKNGEEIQVKVTKVGESEIEYKKWSNQNGPTYTKPVSEIFMIKYENGDKDVFNQTNNNQNNQQQYQGSRINKAQGDVYQERIGSDRMRRDRRDLKIGSRELSENDIRQIFYEDGLSTYNKGRRNFATGNVLWPIGFAMGIVGDIVYIALSLDDDPGLGVAIGLPLSSVGTGLFITGLILKGVGKGRLNSLVEDYNSGRGNTLSLSVQPTLMRTYDKSYAPGVGIALRF
ncbi:MAG: hypothetical protein J6X58_05800 [Bacteroidales bacterium]|nr:hypothetical protein [Bacteroidales bacterium]